MLSSIDPHRLSKIVISVMVFATVLLFAWGLHVEIKLTTLETQLYNHAAVNQTIVANQTVILQQLYQLNEAIDKLTTHGKPVH
jgi:hypothetical protein